MICVLLVVLSVGLIMDTNVLVVSEEVFCSCTRDGDVSICGSDGKTYANPCVFQCAHRINSDPCCECDAAADAGAALSRCGSDNRTYTSKLPAGVRAAHQSTVGHHRRLKGVANARRPRLRDVRD